MDHQLKKSLPYAHSTPICGVEKTFLYIYIYRARPQRRRRPGGVFARVPRPELLSWLEEQEQKPGVFVPPNNPVVEEVDPLLARARIVEEDRGEWERWGHEGKGRNRVILKQWFFTRDLENSIVPRMLDKIRQSVRTRHKLKLHWGILLRNVEDNRPLFWYTNNPGIKTPRYNFLDIMNYMAPGTTYDKWVRTYDATQTKSWIPYEWFDSPDKLDYPGLPSYWCWYSQLKNAFVQSPARYEGCKRVFRERGMQTFGDWLE